MEGRPAWAHSSRPSTGRRIDSRPASTSILSSGWRQASSCCTGCSLDARKGQSGLRIDHGEVRVNRAQRRPSARFLRQGGSQKTPAARVRRWSPCSLAIPACRSGSLPQSDPLLRLCLDREGRDRGVAPTDKTTDPSNVGEWFKRGCAQHDPPLPYTADLTRRAVDAALYARQQAAEQFHETFKQLAGGRSMS